MKRRNGIKMYGSALMVATSALAAYLCSCSSEDKVAGVSTVETENAYVIKVLNEDGVAVSNAEARLRAADYLPSFAQAEGGVSAAVKTFVTDDAGYLRINEQISDSMTLEVLDGNQGAFMTLLAANVLQSDSAELMMNRLGAMYGQVELPAGEEFAWIQIYGTDRMVKTDSEGRYEIPDMAPADYRYRIVVGEASAEGVATVKSGVKAPASSSSENESSSSEEPESSSSEQIIDYLSILDFENGLRSNIVFAGDSSELYLKPTDTTSVVMSPGEYEAELSIVEAGAGREGHAMHWTTSAKTGQWSFMGLWMCSSTNPCDFSVVDSIEYYVRGTGSYSFNLETIIDGATGKAVFLDTLQGADEWERVVIKASDFMEGDSTYGNMGWDFVSKQVTNIAVPAYFDTEIWIDDIRFYGVTKEDLP